MRDSPTNKPVRKRRTPAKAGLLGVGLDNTDGHKRITTGEQFALVGGSQETVVKTFEELKRREKRLETVDPRELAEIVHKSAPQ